MHKIIKDFELGLVETAHFLFVARCEISDLGVRLQTSEMWF